MEGDVLATVDKLNRYTEYLCEGLGHAGRWRGLTDYCQALMLPIERKSVEPMAAHADPQRVGARHQAMHHFVAKSEWSDEAILERVRDFVLPKMGADADYYWIIDDTSFPKKGMHSVGVARQYCGALGKLSNCQVAVSLSIATKRASLPIAYRLYLPKEWVDDAKRRAKTGVPQDVAFATKQDIALAQVRQALGKGVPIGTVLADAGYGQSASFRETLTELGLRYAVGISAQNVVWLPGVAPLPPKAMPHMGRPAKNFRRAPGHEPVRVQDVAVSLPDQAWREVTWREGSNAPLCSRFAALRVHPTGRNRWKTGLLAQEWLLIEWPTGADVPTKYFLSTLPEGVPLEELVRVAKMRWRIERDYQELKQELGLGDYEGRGWRGFHHHASLCIAAYGFLVATRLEDDGAEKKTLQLPAPALPKNYRPRGSGAGAAARARLRGERTACARTGDCTPPP
ncbi:IS701 family transposase [Desulfocurvibacter africanus]|uniref:IS701 family transposase n=1 Tax=Desulfocurvibacter africanus TaxID=873 RepID=UPI002FDAD12E